MEDVCKHLGNKVFKTIIPRNVRLSESPSHGLPIILYDIKSRGAIAYMELAQEILRGER
jgi:chromosome partitioning protein